eukprot:gene13572-13697_t
MHSLSDRGWTAFTFGFAFLAPLQVFCKVSANFNPAMCLAQWVWGNLTGIDFICLSLAEIAGAFVGAILHWVHFLPHYKTLPEPPALDRDDALLRRRDSYKESALQFASYATRPDRKVTSNPFGHLSNTLYYLRPNNTIHEEPQPKVLQHYKRISAPELGQCRAASLTDDLTSRLNPLTRRTIHIADRQSHLMGAHDAMLRQQTGLKCPAGSDFVEDSAAMTNALTSNDDAGAVFRGSEQHSDIEHATTSSNLGKTQQSQVQARKMAANSERVEALNGDQARRFLNEDVRLFYQLGLQNFLICLVIVTMLAGLGGPTAFAVNPARDFGPRLAHALLPIPGKGSSEWSYAWIPFFAPLVGGAVAGALFIALEEMQFPGGGSKGGGLFVG